MTRSVQALAYSRPSVLKSSQAGQSLGLETAGGLTPRGAEPHPRFFEGFLTSPRIAARGLLAVADVAAARYYQRTLMSSLDPVVTGNGDRLRFESFSGCCGVVYARLDVLRDGLDGAETGHGTTNVDVNNPLREALSRIAGDDPLHLRVGPQEMAVTTLEGRVVEKKVPLPDRWLRGFAEAQVGLRRLRSAGRAPRCGGRPVPAVTAPFPGQGFAGRPVGDSRREDPAADDAAGGGGRLPAGPGAAGHAPARPSARDGAAGVRPGGGRRGDGECLGGGAPRHAAHADAVARRLSRFLR